MPDEWKRQARAVGRALRKKGVKDAESKGYAIATANFKRRHGRSPQSFDRARKP